MALEASPLASLIIEQVGFEGTATELLERMKVNADEALVKSKSWPRNVQSLGGALTRLAPNLRAIGVDVVRERETTGRKRKIIALRAVEQEPVTPVTQSPTSPNTRPDAGHEGDHTGGHGGGGDRRSGAGDQLVTGEGDEAGTGARPLPTRDRDALRPAGDHGDRRVLARSEGGPTGIDEEGSMERLFTFSDDAIDEVLASVAARHPAHFADDMPDGDRRDTARMLVEAEILAEGERLLEARRPGFLAKATRDGLITPMERRRMALLEVACERRSGRARRAA
jgi:hypothetical protein